jgi:hypothetical protein
VRSLPTSDGHWLQQMLAMSDRCWLCQILAVSDTGCVRYWLLYSMSVGRQAQEERAQHRVAAAKGVSRGETLEGGYMQGGHPQ